MGSRPSTPHCQARSGISAADLHGLAISLGIVLLPFAPNPFLGEGRCATVDGGWPRS
jgi:hypothetical protein